MTRKRVKHLIITSLLLTIVLLCTEVNAQSYETVSSRVYQNNAIISNSNKMSLVMRESFKDKYLIDLGELNYKGFTNSQYKEILNFANNTILNKNTSLSNNQKLAKFYDFIVDNFYYYNTPDKISALSSNRKYDNPYYLLTEEYNKNGKIRARDHGYASMLVALARTQGIPSRTVGGYYNKNARGTDITWGSDITNAKINHVWVQVYLSGKWIMLDPVADSYKTYTDSTDTYNDPGVENKRTYFNPSVNTLSNTHIAFKTYAGINNFKYVSTSGERKALLSFLNIKSSGTTNGKKINNSYDTSNSNTWFGASDKYSKVNDYGYVTKIYWPSNKGLYGKLSLSNFSKLENLSVPNNKINNLYLNNNKSLKTVNVSNNNISKVIIRKSKNIVSINTNGNPSTYIEYRYRKSQKKAIIKASSGGTVAVYYHRSGNKNIHTIKATPKDGYKFDGWYKKGKKISDSKVKTLKKSKSFTYVAKFIKKNPKTYIKVSISKQKLWYYKNGKLKKTSKVVTGMRHEHDTPKGLFVIRSKARKIYLIGEDYRSYVNYWMPFYGGYGLHDATWRSYFGGDIYKYNGSHGCVNLPYSVAKYLYKRVPVGTIVKIV